MTRGLCMRLGPCVAAVMCVVALGCSSRSTSTFEETVSDAGAGTLGAGSACATASDCASGLACGFAMADHCGARGVCVRKDVGSCLGAFDCACDGTPTFRCGMGAYADKPFAHPGPCGAGSPCTVTGHECGPGLACGFRGCGPGVCVADFPGTGFCPAVTVCGCDGSTTARRGCLLDGDATRSPYAHDGPCDDGGADASTDIDATP